MPQKEEIIGGLYQTANQFTDIAIVWHAIFYLLLAVLFAGWKPQIRLMLLLLSLPLGSVSFFAVLQKNYFNAIVFGMLAVTSLFFMIRAGNQKISSDRSWPDIAGLLLIIFGLVYPGFIKVNQITEYSYASPFALVPCPTLAVIAGFSLMYRDFEARTWALCIAAAGIFYGATSVFYLGAKLDYFLLAGAVILLLNTLLLKKPLVK